MTAVIASSTAMNAVAASSTAMTAVAASSTAMTAVIASSTAMNAVAASSTAMTAVIASSTSGSELTASATAVAALDSSSPIQIPLMTADAAPSGTASTSSLTAGYGAYKALDKGALTYWSTATSIAANSWLAYQFPSSVWVYAYSITKLAGYPTFCPKDIVLQAYNGAVWINVDSRQLPNTEGTNRYILTSPSKYAQWRIFCTNNWGGGTMAIAEFNLWGK
jgi:hypothetical protein